MRRMAGLAAIGIVVVATGLIASGCAPGQLLGPTVTPTPTNTPTPTATPTPTNTPTLTPTNTPTPTSTPTPTNTPTSTSTPTLTPTPTPKPIVYDGTWRGTAGDGRQVSFTVVNNAITYLEAGYGFPGCSADVKLTLKNPKRIIGGAFQITSNSPSLSFSVSGTFGSTTMASGTVDANSSDPHCSGVYVASWSATRQ